MGGGADDSGDFDMDDESTNGHSSSCGTWWGIPGGRRGAAGFGDQDRAVLGLPALPDERRGQQPNQMARKLLEELGFGINLSKSMAQLQNKCKKDDVNILSKLCKYQTKIHCL